MTTYNRGKEVRYQFAVWTETALSMRKWKKTFIETLQKMWRQGLMQAYIQRMITSHSHWKRKKSHRHDEKWTWRKNYEKVYCIKSKNVCVQKARLSSGSAWTYKTEDKHCKSRESMYLSKALLLMTIRPSFLRVAESGEQMLFENNTSCLW